MSSLQKKIAEHPEGKVVVNIVKQFVFDTPPKKQSIRHNMLILAKEVKIYEECGISFKRMEDDKKLKFMICSENFSNIKKLELPFQSHNG